MSVLLHAAWQPSFGRCFFRVRPHNHSRQKLRRCGYREFTFSISSRATLDDLPLSTIPTSSEPTCSCAATPRGLDIDRTLPLNGSMAMAAEYLLVSTGKEDWASRIEDGHERDSPGVGLVKSLKTLLGRRGAFANPYHNVQILNSSFSPDVTNPPASASALLLPSFLRVSQIPYDEAAITNFLKGYLLPSRLHSINPGVENQHLIRNTSRQAAFHPFTTNVREIVILICGHGTRDERCGIMGPLLRDEFLAQLCNAGIRAQPQFANSDSTCTGAVVGLVSHVGGHKFAGNVAIFLPPVLKKNHNLAGKGVWYGRVEPKNVEAIVRETIQKGHVIRDLFRGGVGPRGETLRL